MDAYTLGLSALTIQPGKEKAGGATTQPFRISDSVIHDAQQYLKKVEEGGGKVFLARQYLDRAIAMADEDSTTAAMEAARMAIMLAKAEVSSGNTPLQREGEALLLFTEMVTNSSK
ncbi:MAG: hypothetical protein GY757_42815 [bacterium]|nr:hypothetical protein [bacterium]